jgi:hypothetical protein
MDPIRERIDQWLTRHARQAPTMSDLALLEGLHNERAELFAEFQRVEAAFIDELLRQEGGKRGDSSSPAGG